MKKPTLSRILLVGCLLCIILLPGAYMLHQGTATPRPNILLVIADDWSYPHAGAYGDKVVQTPHFDRLAQQGWLFEHAYVSSPSCTPSRAALLTGQHFWRLGIGANLYGPLPTAHQVYPDLLEKAGYQVGFSGKGWGPGQPEGRPRNPAGTRYEDFASFLAQRQPDKPFCYWFGSYNPHRGYEQGSGASAGIQPSRIQPPACFPNSEAVRSDMADYYKEVQDFDAELGSLLQQLQEKGELENTLIVVTSDNGMPFPRCKSNLYDLGTRVPLLIHWGNMAGKRVRIADFVSLTDLAPTFLQAAGLDVPTEMTGRSLLPYLRKKSKKESRHRRQVFFGKERHLPAQEAPDWGGYPMRAVRTQEFLYIQNLRPDRWPAGTPNYEKATFYPSCYGDVDGGPTRSYMLSMQQADEQHQRLYQLAFGKRPAEELYDLSQDPQQLQNVAALPAYQLVRQRLKIQLETQLRQSGDPRLVGGDSIFESYPYTGGTVFPEHFQRKSPRYATVRLDSFPSAYISPRPVEVLVPVQVSYDQRFPVLYMFDGQNLFHSFTGWGGEVNKGWRVHEVLDSLYLAGSIPQMIVVGIYNSQGRMAEYMPDKPEELLKARIAATEHQWYQSFKTQPPAGGRQLKFIVEELKPYIDAHFHTLPGREHTFVAGSSMGGLISAYAVCEYPEVFGGAACFSTHWPPLEGVFLEYFKTHLPDPATHKFYFDYGTQGLDASYEPFQHIADQALRERGYRLNQNWITRRYEGARHYEDDWHARFHVPIEFLLKQ